MAKNLSSSEITLNALSGDFAVCKLGEAPDLSSLSAPFFLAGTEAETSLVCLESALPEHVTDVERGWKGLVVAGQLDFSLLGILAGLSQVLAEAGVSIFVASTFDTDYLFVRKPQWDTALSALSGAGYSVDLKTNKA